MAHESCGDHCELLQKHLHARKISRKLPFLILYGSETGNAKSISEKVLGLALERGLPSKLATLDEYESLGFISEDPLFCAIVVSTTGNGDPPKGAEKFFRFVKKRTHSTSTLKGIYYTVLALGDTNYDKFCFVGKTIDSRLSAIGGIQLSPVTLADEVAGLDTIVEPWIHKLWVLYASQIESRSASLSAVNLETKIETSLGLSSPNTGPKEVSSLIPNTMPLLEIDVGWAMPKSFVGLQGMTALATVDQCQAKTTRLGRVRPPFPKEKFAPSKTTFNPTKILGWRYLTNQNFHMTGEDRRVIELSLDLPEKTWDVGDAIAIQCPNPESLCLLTAKRLGLNPEEVISTTPQVWTVMSILRYGVNLATPPDRGFLRTLSSFCSDPLDEARMNLLSSIGGKEEYTSVIEMQKLNVLEVLNLFPSCLPNFDAILGALGPEPPPPRYYSIASSPLTGTCKVCFSIVKYDISTNRVVTGVCTNELQRLLVENNELDQLTLMTFVKANPMFKLPVDESKPIIMVGPGTGVAPFLGFIEHRKTNFTSSCQR